MLEIQGYPALYASVLAEWTLGYAVEWIEWTSKLRNFKVVSFVSWKMYRTCDDMCTVRVHLFIKHVLAGQSETPEFSRPIYRSGFLCLMSEIVGLPCQTFNIGNCGSVQTHRFQPWELKLHRCRYQSCIVRFASDRFILLLNIPKTGEATSATSRKC